MKLQNSAHCNIGKWQPLLGLHDFRTRFTAYEVRMYVRQTTLEYPSANRNS